MICRAMIRYVQKVSFEALLSITTYHVHSRLFRCIPLYIGRVRLQQQQVPELGHGGNVIHRRHFRIDGHNSLSLPACLHSQ